MSVTASDLMLSPADWAYRYTATLRKLHDGDTASVDIDLGFRLSHGNVWIRFDGYNAPEITGPQREFGLWAKNYLSRLIAESEGLLYIKTDQVVVQSITRYVAAVYVFSPEDRKLVSVADRMRLAGFHVERPKRDTLAVKSAIQNAGPRLVNAMVDDYVNDRL